MKRIVLITTLIFFNLTGFCQIFIGPKAGFLVASTSSDDQEYNELYDVSWKPGFCAGAILNYPVTKTFGLHSELTFSRKGKVAKLKDGSEKQTAVYNFVDLPFLLNINYSSKKYSLFFNVGPNISYWINSKGVVDSDVLDIYEFPPVKYKVEFSEATEEVRTENSSVLYIEKPNRLHFGLLFGAGTVIKMDQVQSLSVELRYEMGHTHFGKKGDGAMYMLDFNEQMESSNRVISLSVSYWYKINFKDFKRGKSTSRK